MSRIKDYYAWVYNRAREEWRETSNNYVSYYRYVKDIENEDVKAACQPRLEQLKIWDDAAYHAYCFIALADPGNYSAHKRTTHSRRARKRYFK